VAKHAIGFGVALLILGISSYFATGRQSPTALIPAAFGLILFFCGLLARNPARRKLAMHIAVLFSILGFLGSFRGLIGLVRMLAGETLERPNAVIAQAVMAVLTLLFTILAVRSFINARRNRSMETL
jgi:hypothetical protein